MKKEIILSVMIWIIVSLVLSMLKKVRLTLEYLLVYIGVMGVIELFWIILKKRKLASKK